MKPEIDTFNKPVVPDHILLKQIGRGSYGEVWLARNATGAYRAVKVVFRARFDSDKPYEREFRGIQEFEPISRSHPAQVHVLHVGRNDAAGYFYYVMELADDASEFHASLRDAVGAQPIAHVKDSSGARRMNPELYVPNTLRTLLQARGSLTIAECIEIAGVLADGLQDLHAHGLVHRDIKPSNIIFVNGRPKLADIGLVARVDATLSFVGTEGYLPPEGPGKPQADIYSLGKVLYEMACGKDRSHFPEPPTSLKDFPDREAFQELNEVILKACAHDAAERYESAAEMQADLVSLRAGKSLKRSRLLEKRLALLGKLTAAGLIVTVLLMAGYFYQQHQTRKANRLAAELQLTHGIRFMEEGDLSGALLWFVQALEQGHWTGEEFEGHRFRLGAVIGQCPKLVQFFTGGERGLSLDFSPDGRRLLAFRPGPSAQIWDVASGEPLVKLHHSNAVWQAVFSANGARILTASGLDPLLELGNEGEARVWDAATGQPAGPKLQHKARVFRAAFSADGHRIATASDDGTAQIWDAVTGQKLTPPLDHDARVLHVGFSPDGQRLVTTTWGGATHIWDAVSGRIIIPELKHPGPAVSLKPGRWPLLTHRERNVFLWDGETGRPLLPSLEHSDYVLYAGLSPDGRRVFVRGGDGSAQVWDAHTGEKFPLLPKRHDWMTEARFSRNGRWVAMAAGDRVHVWEADTGTLVTPEIPHNGLVWGLRFHPDGGYLATSSPSEPVLRLFDITAGRFATLSFAHSQGVTWAGFSPDGRQILTASSDGTARLWDSSLGRQALPPVEHRGFKYYGHPSFSSDGTRALTASTDKTVQIWDLATGEPVTQALPHEAEVRHAEFSPDGNRIVTATQAGTVHLWDARTGAAVGPRLPKLRGNAYASFSPDGRRLATIGIALTPAFQAQVWDLATGQSLTPPMQGTISPSYSIAFSPDGYRLLTRAHNGDVRVWDARTGRLITRVSTQTGTPIYAAEFSPDGRRIVTAGHGHAAHLWDAASGAELTRPLEHDRDVRYAAFSPDGRRIVTASKDETARVWDARTGLPLTPPLRHRGGVKHVAFSPDGRRIITASEDGSAQVWEFESVTWPIEDLRLLARIQSGRAIDRTGRLTALSPETLQSDFRKLKSRQPAHFPAFYR